MTEDIEMVGWHHQHNGHGFGWTLGVGYRQGGLAYCGSWGCKESDMTEQLSLSLTVAKNLWTASYCLLWLPLAFSHILIHKILII